MINVLVSGPRPLDAFFHSQSRALPSWLARLGAAATAPTYIGSDPAGTKLGSGGGTVNLLYDAWKSSAGTHKLSLSNWLSHSQKLVLHAGGESRRLPAYAALGKAFMPLPAVAGLEPQIHNQILADFQLPGYVQSLTEAGEKAAVMVTSGDVWLDFDSTEIPEVKADVVGIGMQVAPEVAQHFGVFFVAKAGRSRVEGERSIAFFLQKPSPKEIRQHLSRYDFFVDTGMWLLSKTALEFMFRRCGWDEKKEQFRTASRVAEYLDLYTEIGSALGTETKPTAQLKALGFTALASSVIPLDSARFFHLGSSRQLLESLEQVQRKSLTPVKSFRVSSAKEPATGGERLQTWVEGSQPHTPLSLDGFNLVTGLPFKAEVRHLRADHCLDVSPVGTADYVVRPYHIDDSCRGDAREGGKICGQPAARWLQDRGLPVIARDVFELEIYPVLAEDEITQEVVEWFFSAQPDSTISELIRGKQRLSAKTIPSRVDFNRYFIQRREGYIQALKTAFSEELSRGEYGLFEYDFGEIASFCRAEAPELGRWLIARRERILLNLQRPEHQSRFLMLLAELSSERGRVRYRRAGFTRLQSAMVSSQQLPASSPIRSLKEDQIVWSRSPVRLDLAGGWTDTPPFCLEAGGTVLNVAVLLNGQPPIQAFIRPTNDPVLRLRSIDLGSAEVVTTFEQLADFRNPRGNFSLPKAALALSGFLPDFYEGKPFRNLKEQLIAYGGGMEISLLSAVPKGSGLGTSSILGATLLGAMNRACGLGWDDVDLYNRVLGVEQLLTTGGGWQDQAGALFRSVKLVQTSPGSSQIPSVRYLPEHLLGPAVVNQSFLLYYSGATRMAKGILQEIVLDMFLKRAATVRTLETIRANSWRLYHAFQLGDSEALLRGIARSWRLNRQLDGGTSTPEIEKIIATCGDELSACKLLGAGGGGYMLLCARTPAGGKVIRDRLEASPPNPRARFIDFSIAPVGLQVTVS